MLSAPPRAPVSSAVPRCSHAEVGTRPLSSSSAAKLPLGSRLRASRGPISLAMQGAASLVALAAARRGGGVMASSSSATPSKAGASSPLAVRCTGPAEALLPYKEVQDVLLKPPAHWVGDGFRVLPVFHNKAFTRAVSPFLMFDYAPPKQFEPTGKKLGVGQHPHRGFETVTIAWQGEVEHGDHLGHRDVIRPGDVQWMTAARGIIHEEFHSREFSQQGGTFEMCQLWVNLPKEHKMSPARYQPITANSIPSVDLEDGAGRVRVIAGQYQGVRGPAQTFSPIDMWEVLLTTAGKSIDLVFPPGHNTIIFVKRGTAAVGATEHLLGEQDVALMGEHGQRVPLRAMVDKTEVLVLSGEPFNEPIAAMGPFVMNTEEELRQATMDFRKGTNGFGQER